MRGPLRHLNILLLWTIFPLALSAQHLPEEFYSQLYSNQFDFPTVITFDAEGRMFVAEKEGKVYIIDSSGNVLDQPLIDISEEVSNWKDHGLMGFALDPGFLTNGYFYLLYALDLHHYEKYGTPAYHPDSTVTFRPTIGRITRYKASPASNFTRALPDSRRVLLGDSLSNGIPLLYEFHGLGHLAFGQDGSLLVSCGDATSPGGTDIGGDSHGTMATPALEKGILTPDQDIGSYRAQYLGSYNGKILRLDPQTGDGLPSNPFYNEEAPCSPRSRTWAWGLRNPYRFTVKPNSGSHFPEDGQPGVLFVGDVGNGAFEELDIVEFGGQNFGWPIMEGLGGHWPYRNTEPPANQLRPNPLYGNGCEEAFFDFQDVYVNVVKDGNEPPANPCNEAILIEDFVVGYPPAICWSNSRWNPPTRALVPFFNDKGEINGAEIGTPRSGMEGENFDGYSSLAGVFYDAERFPEKYRGKFFAVDFSGWIQLMDINDDNKPVSVEPFHQYARDIIHLALNPVDGNLYYVNLQGEIHQISYGGNPAPVAAIEADRYYGPAPLTVQFDASGSFDSNLPLTEYLWDFGDGDTSRQVAPSHTFYAEGEAPQSFEVSLRVTDSLGASALAKAIVSLNNSPPAVEISSFEDGGQYPMDKGTTLLRLAAEVSDEEHRDEELAYEWRTFVHHNAHFHPDPPVNERETYALISPVGCDGEEYWYRIELTVTDPAGLSGTDTRLLYPYCGEPFLEWTKLRGEVEEEQAVLYWDTQMEDSLSHFEIQHSPDFFQFTSIGTLTARNDKGTYRFPHPSPRRGQNIYRIKAIRKGGAYTYSNTVEIGYPKPLSVRLFPNPVKENLQLSLKKAEASTVELELYNPAGLRVLQRRWDAMPENPFSKTITTTPLPNGLYYYRVLNGELEKAGQLMIARP